VHWNPLSHVNYRRRTTTNCSAYSKAYIYLREENKLRSPDGTDVNEVYVRSTPRLMSNIYTLNT
jgi:hypothetical protein